MTKILRPHDPPTDDERAQAEKYRNQVQIAIVYHYIDNVRFIKVPFFGIAFDVNDLGTIGGLAILTILVLLRYSLSREIKNLNISFEEAFHHNKLSAFYHALAMRQLFTVPHMKGETQNRKLARLPEFVAILPAIIFSLGVLYDLLSTFVFALYSPKNVTFTLITESVWLVFIWWLSWICLNRKRRINKIWDSYWRRMPEAQRTKTSVVMLNERFVKEFGSDQAVDDALNELLEISEKTSTPEKTKTWSIETLRNLRPIEAVRDLLAKPPPETGEINTPLILLNQKFVEKFGNDKAVNDALGELLKRRALLTASSKPRHSS